MMSRVITGVAAGVFSISAYSIAAKLASTGRQGRAMANVAMGYSTSLVFGVPIGRLIAAIYDWKIIFWGIVFFGMLSIWAISRIIPAMESETPVPLGKQLALLKNIKISLVLGVTLFMYIGYSVVNTYITPFIAAIMPVSDQKISTILFVLGIASLIGSKLGGFLADRIGIALTIIGSLVIQAVSLVLISTVSGSTTATMPLLMLWMITAWVFGSTQNFNIVSLASEASSIMLSLNICFTQLGFAAGAGIGGIAIGGSSIMAISWIGAISVTVAVLAEVVSLSLVRSHNVVNLTK
jgi:DHA1 family putative efflux transporter-like MFS transporter